MGNKGSSSSSDDAQLDDVKKLSRVMHVSEKQLQKMQKSFKSHSKGGNCVDLAGFTSLLGTFGVDLKQHQLSAETIFKVFLLFVVLSCWKFVVWLITSPLPFPQHFFFFLVFKIIKSGLRY